MLFQIAVYNASSCWYTMCPHSLKNRGLSAAGTVPSADGAHGREGQVHVPCGGQTPKSELAPDKTKTKQQKQ